MHTSASLDLSLYVYIYVSLYDAACQPRVRAQLVQVDALLLTRSERHKLRTTNFIPWQQNKGARVRPGVYLGAVSDHHRTGLLDIQLVTARNSRAHTHTKGWSLYTRRQPNINSVCKLKVFGRSTHEISGVWGNCEYWYAISNRIKQSNTAVEVLFS